MNQKHKACYNLCRNFIDNHDITCEETIYQVDSVRESLQDFVVELCELIGYVEAPDERD